MEDSKNHNASTQKQDSTDPSLLHLLWFQIHQGRLNTKALVGKTLYSQKGEESQIDQCLQCVLIFYGQLVPPNTGHTQQRSPFSSNGSGLARYHEIHTLKQYKEVHFIPSREEMLFLTRRKDLGPSNNWSSIFHIGECFRPRAKPERVGRS